VNPASNDSDTSPYRSCSQAFLALHGNDTVSVIPDGRESSEPAVIRPRLEVADGRATAEAKGPAMVHDQPGYVAYLLRLWQIRSDGRLVWLASLTDPHTAVRRGFASVPHLIAFLEAQTEGRADGQDDGETRDG